MTAQATAPNPPAAVPAQRIPWYRDVNTLRVLTQVIFVLVLILSTSFILTSLVINLAASSTPLDFSVYRRPFNVAISEGISLTEQWMWTQNPQAVQTAVWIVWIGAMIVTAVVTFRAFRSKRLNPLAVIAGLAGAALPVLGARLTEVLQNLFSREIAAFNTWLISINLVTPEFVGIFLGFVVWFLYFTLIGVYLYRIRRHRGAQLAALIFIFLVIGLIVYPPPALAQALIEFFNAYLAPSTMTRALITGIYNTLIVVILSMIACTLLGIFLGVGLLSRNFLARNAAQGFVEIFRNTPLAVQLIFIYRLLTLLLPEPRNAISVPAPLDPAIPTERNFLTLAINNRGFYFVNLIPTETAGWLLGAILIGILASVIVWRLRKANEDRTGEPARTWLFITPILFGAAAIGWVLSGTPFTPDYPYLQGPNVRAGLQMTMGFVSLFLGLTCYTAAFVAEIVRAGIQSVSFGQIEAGRSQGFGEGQILSMIILPQALRLIIPPMGNQYVNLGKNSSLAIIVNYPDAYRIAQLANNESGQAVPFFVGLMLIYLAISLTFSLLTNIYNQTTQLKTR